MTEIALPCAVLNVILSKTTVQVQLQEGQQSAKQLKLDATPVVRKDGPLICIFDGPAEKLVIDLVKGIAPKKMYELKFCVVIITCHLQHFLGSG